MGGSGVLLKEVFYPNNDGGPMAETGIHVCEMVALIAALRYFFFGEDVYIIGNICLYPCEGDPTVVRVPDIMVLKGVPSTPERRSIFTWVEGAVPCCVVELTSKETKEEDQGPKKEFYRRWGVRELFLFDPEGDYLPAPLMGYRLVPLAANGNGESNGNGDPRGGPLEYVYDELQPFADGSIPSAELGLLLRPVGNHLVLLDRRTNEVVPTPAVLYQQVEQLVLDNRKLQQDFLDQQQRAADEKKRADDEKKRADDEKKRADALERDRDNEKKRADDEKTRADDLEREIALLRAQLSPPPPPS